MTEADYNSKIEGNNQAITGLKNEIDKLEEEINALKKMKQKTLEIEEEMERIADSLYSKFDGDTTLFGSITSFLKQDVFSNILNALKGNEYKEATSGLVEMSEKIQSRIAEVEKEIETKEGSIRQLQSNNNGLQAQKKAYLEAEAAKAETAAAQG